MLQATAIDVLAERPDMHENVLSEIAHQNPGSINYSIKRFLKPPDWMREDTGLIHYQYSSPAPHKSSLELRFCVTGHVHCRETLDTFKKCKVHAAYNCHEKVASIDVLSFVFTPGVLAQLVKPRLSSDTLADNVLAFRHK